MHSLHRPSSAVYDPRNMRGVYAVVARQINLLFSGRTSASDAINLIARQLGHARPFASCVSCAAFMHHIAHVVTASTNKQVLNVYARSVVTFVANLHAIRNITPGKKPRETMCEHTLIRRQPNPDLSITVYFCAYPLEAPRFGEPDPLPKPIAQYFVILSLRVSGNFCDCSILVTLHWPPPEYRSAHLSENHHCHKWP